MAAKVPSPISVVEGVIGAEGRLGDFIANGPSDGLGGYVRDQYRKRCDQFANAPGWARLLVGGSAGTLGRVCQPWYDGRGFDPPTKSTEFPGGQCPTLYNVTATYSFASAGCDTLGPFTDTYPNKPGPISISYILDSGFAESSGGLCPGFSRNRWTLTPIDGNTNVIGVPRGVNIIAVNFSRADGQPDDCGDQPPELRPGPNPPPNPGPTPGPEPTTDPNNPTGVPLLPIPDYEDPIGGPTPVVGPDPNEPTLGPTDIPGSSDSQEGGPENVSEPITVDPGPAGGGNNTGFGDPPDGRAWVGCILQFAIPSSIGAIAGSGPTNPVTPRTFGNASLVLTGGLDTPERVNGGNMVLVRKSGTLKVTGVYVNVEPGFTYTVKPISIAKCPENTCGA